ncbi:hypothetical protein [Stenotrophomonas maltophilia]|uniref:hypothetical protein n=1 Tax=Stenotrophomonas maltophilia TaxID=40324 RepID=UPI002E79F53E|nr:hypothetical protein [Stenotrophomonas maltophilia]
MRVLIPTIILLVPMATASAKKPQPALYVERSTPGESMDAFILRIAPEALSKSERQGAEVCGVIAEGPAGYSIRLSSGTARTCEMDFADIEQGYRPTDQTFHTHIYSAMGHSEFTRADYAVKGYLAQAWKLLHQDGRGTARYISRDLFKSR